MNNLEKLAYMALISNSISEMLNRSTLPKPILHKLQDIRMKLDNDFVSIITQVDSLNEPDDVGINLGQKDDEEEINKRLAEEKNKIKVKQSKKVTTISETEKLQ